MTNCTAVVVSVMTSYTAVVISVMTSRTAMVISVMTNCAAVVITVMTNCSRDERGWQGSPKLIDFVRQKTNVSVMLT